MTTHWTRLGETISMRDTSQGLVQKWESYHENCFVHSFLIVYIALYPCALKVIVVCNSYFTPFKQENIVKVAFYITVFIAFIPFSEVQTPQQNPNSQYAYIDQLGPNWWQSLCKYLPQKKRTQRLDKFQYNSVFTRTCPHIYWPYMSVDTFIDNMKIFTKY